MEKVKYKETIWTNLDQQEKEEALKKMDGFAAVQFLLFFLVISFTAYYVFQVSEMQLTREDPRYLSVLMMVVFLVFLIYSFSGWFTAAMLERSTLKGGFTVIGLLLVVGFTFLTSGGNFILGLIYRKGVRKKIIKKVNPRFLRDGENISVDRSNESFDTGRNTKLEALQCLSDGIKLEQAQKYKSAKTKYEEAYRLGDGRGAYYLARMYEDGLGCSVDISASLSWERKAADMNVSISQYYVGLELIKGKHLNKNEQLGMSYLQKSADQEEYDALFYLGLKYGSSMEEQYFDLARAEDFLIRACIAGENDDEKGEAYNELARLWIGLWGDSNDEYDFKMALQLFKKGKELYCIDAIDNYDRAIELRPSEYASVQTLLDDWLIDAYIHQHDASKFKETINEGDPFVESAQEDNQESKGKNQYSTPNASLPRNAGMISDYQDLRRGLIVSSIFKTICFAGGVLILRYGLNHGEDLFILLPFVIVGGIIVAGLPGLPKAFNDSYNFNNKWDRFFKQPEYKAEINYQKRTIKVKKNDDWFGIIYVALLNLIKTACAAPFEVIRDVYRIFVINKKIKEIE